MCNQTILQYLPKLIGLSLYILLEYHIGKTKKVDSNSLLELIINTFLRRKL